MHQESFSENDFFTDNTMALRCNHTEEDNVYLRYIFRGTGYKTVNFICTA